MRWYEIDPCYAFHVVNGFDTGDQIVIDVVRYRELWRHTSTKFEPAALHRWTIDRTAGKVIEEGLDDRAVEFPRTDDRVVGRPHRYGYTLTMSSFDSRGQLGGFSLLKHDFWRVTAEAHDFGPGKMPGEGTFVPASEQGAEDEGYVLTYVYDTNRNASEFVILDGTDFRAPPLATVAMPQRIPFGFHGNWVGDEALPG